MGDLTIGKLAKCSDVGVETVRFYERKGLLRRPTKNLSGFRHYDPSDARRIRFIKRAQDLGFTLKEVKELIDLNANSKATCSDVRGKAEEKLAEVESKIKDLKRMKQSLKDLAEACGDGKQAVAQCRVLDCFESGWKCE
jgi:MerR family mercuric resistance operon transcriptional regulator